MSTPVAPENMKRRQQLVQTYKMAKKSDTKIGLWMLGAFIVGAAIGFGLFYILPGSGVLGLVMAIVGALLFGILFMMIVFGRRAQKAAFNQMDGQRGAAAAALGMLRRGWKTDPAVAFTKQQDVVHRVIGPPGIVLVGEGSPARVKQLLINERRKHERVASETPIHEIVCGNGEGEVPLPKLVKHVTKLGKNIKGAEMTDLLYRIKALDANRSNIPLPKGPVPTNMKGQRGNLRGR
ncbi:MULTISPECIES: DUF4191 domain-containing protein [unclassified Nocardioides]|uniref:DUF4191 domain-containing protein n=1 Tax=unclassified Nocardioides TaxID=2615069 RepID=UPI0006F70916|nr:MULTISPECIES: DUF4191 domain-containing protein [unclassified Nocardioides]KQY64585.1 hypothetical protein ASD30_06630 [Nocardioides sp. Root140]KQZ70511.1 hypothetical protein ASD66_12960 [Nocardioides sp. Root151]KRF20780.1 hypothetical protein ASH02_00215 [Nocardioides sp. Soil796]